MRYEDYIKPNIIIEEECEGYPRSDYNVIGLLFFNSKSKDQSIIGFENRSVND